MKGIQDYINYFRDIAIQHGQIGHNILSEYKNYTKDEDCHFAIFSTEEVVAGLRSNISTGNVLFLHPYFASGKENESGTEFGSMQESSFMILQKADYDDNNALTSALAETEKIAWDVIRRIYNDANGAGPNCANNFFYRLNLNRFSLEPVQNLFEGRHGWYVKFQFELKRSDFFYEEVSTANGNNPWSINPINR